MKVGVSGFFYGLPYRHMFPEGPPIGLYAAVATKADELGYDSFSVGDHMVFPTAIPDTYPYSPDGVDRHHFPAQHRYDPWALFTYLAALTENIRFCHHVLILPLHNPFATARGVTTLDVLSNGRAMLGVGVGWLREEFNVVGETYENRGARTDEILEMLKLLWTEETIEYRGKHYSFGAVKFEPKSVQKPHPPILIGGNSPAALRRAARIGDGWIPSPDRETQRPITLEEIEAMLAQIMRMRRDAGRDDALFDVTVPAPLGTSTQATLDNFRRYEDAGVTRVTVSPWPMDQPLTDKGAAVGLERFADEVLSKL